jgi:hypothetical protein
MVRRKSLWRTRRDLNRLLDAQGRDAAMAWWSGAETVMKGVSMSGPGEFVATTLPMTLVPDHDERAVAALNIAIRAGYALRFMVRTVTGRVGTIDVSRLISSQSRSLRPDRSIRRPGFSWQRN